MQLLYISTTKTMHKNLSRYLISITSTTLVLGLVFGGAVIYLQDVSQHTYNNDWDNPLNDFILFLLVGTGEAIIPLLVLYFLVRVVLNYTLPYQKALIYLSGLACTIAPFVQLYNMVNEGYHRDNVITYAISFVISLILSYILYRAQLSALCAPVNSSQEI